MGQHNIKHKRNVTSPSHKYGDLRLLQARAAGHAVRKHAVGQLPSLAKFQKSLVKLHKS
jgi:hypothetical protein